MFMARDIVVNVSLYVPLGFVAHFVFKKPAFKELVFKNIRLPLFALYGPVLLGLLLSTAVEITQLWEPLRDTSLLDVITNVMGAALGVALALLFEDIAVPRPRRAQPLPVDRSALALAFCWGAWLIFPLFPVLGLYVLRRKLAAFAHSPLLAPVTFLSAAAVWYAAGLLMNAAGIRRSTRWLRISILAIPAQFFVVDRQPVPSDLLGALAGFVLFAFRPRMKPVSRSEAAAFSALLVLRGLSPFRFVATATAFSWIPFSGVLYSEWQQAVLTLLGKMFYYATAIWLFRAAGVRMFQSIAFVAAILAAIEVLQTHLPGRTPEITDPLLAILMGFVLFILFRETGKRFQSAG
jgi:VanZ family protein